MKTILWATLTANGNYAQSTPDHPPQREALEDFASYAKKAGNFIVGRRTFEGSQAESNRKVDDVDKAFAGVDIVIVSRRDLKIPGVTRVATPKEALTFLKQKGAMKPRFCREAKAYIMRSWRKISWTSSSSISRRR